MADKRMLAKRIIESDSFMNLSAQAQSLYIHLILNADDDGVVDNAQTVIRLCNVTEDALSELIQTGYILPGAPEVFVIVHWGLHNSVPKRSYKPTVHKEVKVNLNYEDGVWSIRS